MSFHVPEVRRRTHGRLASSPRLGNNGAFELPSPMPGRHLLIIASDGDGWEHVSVHVEDSKGRLKLPQWEEMCYVKLIFWDREDCVVQYHPPESEYVNCHRYTLHLWRPIGITMHRPPAGLVGGERRDDADHTRP